MGIFDGKVVLVTGAGRGAGRAIAAEFAAAGARLAVNDISPVNLDITVAQARAAGAEVHDYIFDIAKRLPAQALIAQVLADFGRLDILVNHASVAPQQPLLTMDEWDWCRTVDVNLNGAFFLMQAASVAMAGHDGVIIQYVLPPAAQADRSAALTISKAGVLALVEAAAIEFSLYNIRVHAVYAQKDVEPTSILTLCASGYQPQEGQF
jgi:3-oxoacyl-[acyl-carrier protein] reductase